MRRIPNQPNREAVFVPLQHSKRLAETQITHHVEREVVTPICHILAHTPPFPLCPDCVGAGSEPVGECPHILKDVPLHRFHGAVGEGMREHAAFPRMGCLVNATMRVVGVLVGREGGIEVGLLDRCVKAVDALEGGGGVDRETVRAEADELS